MLERNSRWWRVHKRNGAKTNDPARRALTRLALAFGAIVQPATIAQGQSNVSTPIWLDQGWTEQQRQRFHHQSQGTLTLPIPTSWFLALQQDGLSPSVGLVSDPAYLRGFGFIPSPRSEFNPDGLPIGFARTTGVDPRTGERFDRLGLTCAACHTARLDYQGRTVLIDGGPAMINLGEFGSRLGYALGVTLAPTRFRRFADRVLGPNASAEQRAALRGQLVRAVAAGLGDAIQGPPVRVEEGFGRLDALNRIGNTVFGSAMGIEANRVPITAPVAYPHIWDTSWFTWVQYNGSIEQPMVRNAGEAMGVGAIINFEGGATPAFTSTIPVDGMHAIEMSLAGRTPPHPAGRFSGLRSPAWPEQLFGSIDRALVQEGASLYRQHCQACHLPAPNTPEFWGSDRWTAANGAGERYLDLLMIPISTIGTDPAQAQDMTDRTVLVPARYGLPDAIGSAGGMNRYSYGPALGWTVQRVVTQWYDSQTPPTSAADRDRMNGYRANGIRAPLAYKARPLNGIWATAPYLHNGAVLTLFDLLSPLRERPVSIRLGTTQFDPRNVGYVNAGGTMLNTSLRGNSRGGHLFDDTVGPGRIGPAFSPAQRRALIEYLKTL